MRYRAVVALCAAITALVGVVPARGETDVNRYAVAYHASGNGWVFVGVTPDQWFVEERLDDEEDSCFDSGTFPSERPGTDGLTYANLEAETECGAVDVAWAPTGNPEVTPDAGGGPFGPRRCSVDGRPPRPGVFVGAGAVAEAHVDVRRPVAVTGAFGAFDMSEAHATMGTSAHDYEAAGVVVWPCFPWQQ